MTFIFETLPLQKYLTFRVKMYQHFCHVTELYNISQILIFIYNVKTDYSKEHRNHFTPD